MPCNLKGVLLCIPVGILASASQYCAVDLFHLQTSRARKEGDSVTHEADILFLGGPVFTSDPERLTAEAVAVKKDRILSVGNTSEIASFKGPRTTVVDLKGRLLMPGFIDAHVHLAGYGANRLHINCKFPQVKSIGDIKQKVRERALARRPGTDQDSIKWIRGWGYDQLKLEEKRHPTRFDLDEVCPDIPVLLMRTCGHIAVVNTKVLEMAGITRDTRDPTGGKFDRDESGMPNGVLRETAMSCVIGLSAPPHEEIVSAIEAGSRDFLSRGITSVHEAGVLLPQMRAFFEAVDSGRAKVRVYAMLGYSDPSYQQSFFSTGVSTTFGDHRLKIGPIKLMADGSSSGPTAATRQPYAIDPDDRGILYLTQQQICAQFAEAHRSRFQVTAHAVGDQAVEMVINGIEYAMHAFPRKDARHRIEHCAMTDNDLRHRIRDLGIIPVLQPVFFHEFGDGYVRNYGRARAEQMFAAASFLKLGVVFAMSTDCPVTFPDPMLNVYTAITRRTMTGDVVGPDERISVSDALYAYTMGGAFASFEERVKGSIEPGKLADLVVLSGNPLVAEPEEIRHMKADMTIVGGEVVYEE